MGLVFSCLIDWARMTANTTFSWILESVTPVRSFTALPNSNYKLLQSELTVEHITQDRPAQCDETQQTETPVPGTPSDQTDEVMSRPEPLLVQQSAAPDTRPEPAEQAVPVPVEPAVPAVPIEPAVPSPCPDVVETEADKRARWLSVNSARKLVADEIISSENLYLTYLNTVRDVYILPVKEKHLVTPQDSKAVFSDWLSILQFNTLLYARLTERMQNWDETCNLGDIFLMLKDFLRIYSGYCANYDTALDTLTRYDVCNVTLIVRLNKKSDFRKFVAAAAKDERCRRLDLPALLAMPMQRVPRYVMLLNELNKRTADDHADKALTRSAINSITDVAHQINERV